KKDPHHRYVRRKNLTHLEKTLRLLRQKQNLTAKYAMDSQLDAKFQNGRPIRLQMGPPQREVQRKILAALAITLATLALKKKSNRDVRNGFAMGRKDSERETH